MSCRQNSCLSLSIAGFSSLSVWNYSKKPITSFCGNKGSLYPPAITNPTSCSPCWFTLFLSATPTWPCVVCYILPLIFEYMSISSALCQVSGVWPSSKPWGRNASITNRVNRRQLKQGDAYKARCIQESIM